MRFFVDANLPRAALAVFQKYGHDVSFARDLQLSAASDAEIALHAQHSAAALVTRDLDFADIRRYPPSEFSGIVVLRVPDTWVATRIVRVLDGFLADRLLVNSLPGRLAIIEPDCVRFRPPVVQ